MANILQEFAVLLGWEVNKASQQRATQAIKQVTEEVQKNADAEKRASQEIEREYRRRAESAERLGRDIGVALGRTIGGSVGQLLRLAATLGSAFAGIRLFNNMVSDLKALENESQRAGATVRNIQALQYAFEKIGSSGDQALGAINGIAQALRENRGNRAYMEQLGVGKDVTDTVEQLEIISRHLRSIPADTALAKGQVLGLTDEMVRTLRLPSFADALAEARRIQREWGVDLEAMAKRAKALVDEYNRLSLQASNIRILIMGALMQAAGPFVQGINDTLEKNAAAISGALNTVSDAIRSWAAAGSQQILDWFKELFDAKNADLRKDWLDWANNFKQASTEAAAAVRDIAHALQQGLEFAKELWRVMNLTADVISGKKGGLALEGMMFDPATTPTPGTVGPPIPREIKEAAEKQEEAAKKFGDAVDEDKRAREAERSGGGLWGRLTGYLGGLFGMGGGSGPGGGGGGPGGGGGGGTSAARDRGGFEANQKGGAPFGVPNVGNMSADERNKLGLILQHESNFRNIPNYINDATHTAQGYYQITNTNWRRLAPQLGISAQSAMGASLDDQTKVALALMRESGIGNWANYNKKLSAALARGDKAIEAGPGGVGVPNLDRSSNISALNVAMAGARESGLHVTSSVRSPDDPLSKANPGSAHVQGRAFDLRAKTAEEADAVMKSQREWFSKQGLREGEDYTFKDEVRHAAPWATGPHVHVQLKDAGVAKLNAPREGVAGAARGLVRNVNALVGDRSNAIQVGNAAAAAGAEAGPLNGNTAPLATPSSTDNSKSVTQTNEYNTTIHATDPNAAASAFRRSNEINSGLAIGQIKGAIR
jgi:hypothetical protein